MRNRSDSEARAIRSSMAQELYSALFSWVTHCVSSGIAPPPSVKGGRQLGLLDLYGFEVFSSNGFEQFLINYCNEKLQQLFNRQVYLREASEYSEEGLVDGQMERLVQACWLPALPLLEGDPDNVGIFGVINDRSRCGFEGSVTAVTEAVVSTCGSHSAFRRSNRDPNRCFGIAHFAGDVFYDTEQFVRKNAAAHRSDITTFLRQHGGRFVYRFLNIDATESLRGECHDDVPSQPSRKLGGTTITTAFRAELNSLCAMLEARECRHIRCLRPNDSQSPSAFQHGAMLRQCRYSGLFEATRIRSRGFTHRRTFGAFAQQFRPVLLERRITRAKAPRAGAPDSDVCAAICEVAQAAGVSSCEMCMGKTKIFLRVGALRWLDDELRRVAASKISAVVRARKVREYIARGRRAIVRLQACVRGRLARVRVVRVMREELAEAERVLHQQIAETLSVTDSLEFTSASESEGFPTPSPPPALPSARATPRTATRTPLGPAPGVVRVARSRAQKENEAPVHNDADFAGGPPKKLIMGERTLRTASGGPVRQRAGVRKPRQDPTSSVLGDQLIELGHSLKCKGGSTMSHAKAEILRDLVEMLQTQGGSAHSSIMSIGSAGSIGSQRTRSKGPDLREDVQGSTGLGAQSPPRMRPAIVRSPSDRTSSRGVKSPSPPPGTRSPVHPRSLSCLHSWRQSTCSMGCAKATGSTSPSRPEDKLSEPFGACTNSRPGAVSPNRAPRSSGATVYMPKAVLRGVVGRTSGNLNRPCRQVR